MDTAKVYYDSFGDECSISEMVRREPQWAANRIQEGERAIEDAEQLRSQVSALQAENEELLRGVSDAMCALQDAPEINPSNYDHDQVCKLNTECTYAFRILHSLSGGDA